jgi:hypothetical protein
LAAAADAFLGTAGEASGSGSVNHSQRPQPVMIHYSPTDSFVALLHQLGVPLLVNNYHANKLLAVRR